MDVEISVKMRIEIPDGSEIETGATGLVIGFRMPCGRLIRPWVSYEIEEDDDYRDLGYEELMSLGIDTSDCNVDREIQEL